MLAVVVAGLYLGHHEGKTSYAARLQARAIWRMVDFLLESVVFALIGLQLPAVIDGPARHSSGHVAWYAAWCCGGDRCPDRLGLPVHLRAATGSRGGSGNATRPPWQGAAVVSWAGMRGVVSLAAAFALAADFPSAT